MMTRRPGSSPLGRVVRGFTLIELLVVTTIIMLLVGTLVVAVMTVRKRTMQNATTGILVKVVSAMEAYKAAHGAYPPDGYDFEVEVFHKRIEGSACLAYYLATPQPTTRKKPDGTLRYTMHAPFLEGLQTRDFSFPIDDWEKNEEVPQILDAWGTTLFYDRVANPGEFSAPLTLGSHPDPRTPAGEEAPTPEMGAYQIWSLGPDGPDRTEAGDPTNDLKSWEVR